MASIEELAKVTLKSIYGGTLVSFVVIGIQLFMCFYGLIVFLETPAKTRQGRGSYMAVSFLILVLFCFSQAGDAVYIFNMLFNSASPVEALRLRRKYDHTWWRISSSSCLWVVNWIGDGLLVYRCYVVWNHKRWVCILPGLAYLASIAMSTMTTVSLASSTSETNRFNKKTFSAWIFLSVSVTVQVTALISFRLLRLRQQMTRVLPSKDMNIYLGIVAILVESALPFTISGLAFATVNAISPTSTGGMVADAVFLLLWFSLTALCPQMIIFRVTIGRSWLNNPGANTTNLLTNIAFNHSVTETEFPGVGFEQEQDGRKSTAAMA